MNGVRFLKGVEANILSVGGDLDMPADYLDKLDFVLAGFHEICFAPQSLEEHMKALEATMRNPLVDAISQPGTPVFPIDIEAFVRMAGESGKPVEINNGSFRVRPGSAERCTAIARACIRQGVRVVCGSDAHISLDVGRFDKVLRIFKEIGMPKDLVINSSIRLFDAYLEERRARIAKAASTRSGT
jgi:putative hydrolase